MKRLEIQYRSVLELKPRENNPRTHTTKQIEKIAKSIQRFGFVNPILVDDDGYVIAGHGRLAAAKLIELSEVPILQLKEMSPADRRAYVIADNQLATLAGWSKDLLAIEFAYLGDLSIDFDLTVTGFELAEIDGLVAGEDTRRLKADRLDKTPELGKRAITRSDDLWQLGEHRLICADAGVSKGYRRLLESAMAAMVFCDPPYNVPVNGHVSGRGKVQHREFPMGTGEMTSAQYVTFLRTVFQILVDESVNGSIHYHCIDWRSVGQMLEAGHCYDELKNICVWNKGQGGMGSLYRSAHELVCVFKNGTKPHVNNVELGKNGRYRTNIWSHAGANSFGRDRDQNLAMHPTVKPVALVYDAILDCSRRGDIILDPFAGSGTTLVAAHKAKRRGYGIELDPLYCDLIVDRMRKLFGLEAILAGDGRSFEEVAAERAAHTMEAAA